MLRRTLPIAFLLPTLLFSACDGFRNPFVKEAPFVPTPVPDDFTIIVDENHDTFTTRQHVEQTIYAKTGISHTVYTIYRDYNNSIASSFFQDTPLSPSQLQAMWNSVGSENVMNGSSLFINWLADTDLHQRNSYVIQILANGQSRTYKQTNGFSGRVQPLMRLVTSVRLPVSQNDQTPVIGTPAPASSATPTPVLPAPETAPATVPATMSASTSPTPPR